MTQRILITTTIEGSKVQVQIDGVWINGTHSLTQEEAWQKAKHIIDLFQRHHSLQAVRRVVAEETWNKVL